jgi:hypothetical protein
MHNNQQNFQAQGGNGGANNGMFFGIPGLNNIPGLDAIPNLQNLFNQQQ